MKQTKKIIFSIFLLLGLTFSGGVFANGGNPNEFLNQETTADDNNSQTNTNNPQLDLGDAEKLNIKEDEEEGENTDDIPLNLGDADNFDIQDEEEEEEIFITGNIFQVSNNANDPDKLKPLANIEISLLNPKTRQESIESTNTTASGYFLISPNPGLIDNENKKTLILIKDSNNYYLKKIVNIYESKDTVQNNLKIFLTPNPNNPIPTSAKHLTIEGTGFDGILKNNIFVKAGGGFDGYKEGKAGNEDQLLRNFFSGDNGILTIVLQILGTLGILYFIIGGIRYIFSNGDDENKEKAKNQILWGAVGLLILSMAEFVGFEFINPYETDILEDGFAKTWHTKVNQMIRIIEYIVGGLFLLNGTVSAYNLATSRGQSDVLDSEKTFIQTFIWGFAFILLAETIVRIVTLDSRAEQQAVIFDEVGGIINFILSFFAGAAALMIILSALYYTISFGNDEQVEKAKSILKYSAIAFVIAFSSYVIAQFIIV